MYSIHSGQQALWQQSQKPRKNTIKAQIRDQSFFLALYIFSLRENLNSAYVYHNII